MTSVSDKTKLICNLADEVRHMVFFEKDIIIIERLEHIVVIIRSIIKQLKKGDNDGSVL